MDKFERGWLGLLKCVEGGEEGKELLLLHNLDTARRKRIEDLGKGFLYFFRISNEQQRRGGGRGWKCSGGDWTNTAISTFISIAAAASSFPPSSSSFPPPPAQLFLSPVEDMNHTFRRPLCPRRRRSRDAGPKFHPASSSPRKAAAEIAAAASFPFIAGAAVAQEVINPMICLKS